MLASAILLIAAQDPAFERECRVRALAADPAAASDSIAASLAAAREPGPASSSKALRPQGALMSPGAPGAPDVPGAPDAPGVLDVLDALHRVYDARPELEPGPWLAELEALVSAAHPNLRAGAWRVLADLGRAPREDSPAGASSTWEERLERARARARAGLSEPGPARSDEDPRVAVAELAEGIQSPSRDDERSARAWLEVFQAALARADDSAIELLPLIELAPRGEGLARRVADLAAGLPDLDPANAIALRTLCLACVARQGGALSAAELDELAAGWHATSRRQPGARSLLARAARALGDALGERLAARAATATGEEARHDLLEGAVEALDPTRLLVLLTADGGARPELAHPLFESLRGRVERWDADALRAWVDERLDADQRARIVLVVAETFRQNRDPEAAEFLVRTLSDRDPEVAAEAFQGLAGAPDPKPYMEALHAAWSEREQEWREARLSDLSREIAWTPFRGDLLEIASESRAASARAAELLAPFRGDREVFAALSEWLEQDLGRLRPSSGGKSPVTSPGTNSSSDAASDVIASALSLVRALALVGGDDAVPGLQRALVQSRGRSIDLGKTCLFYLGRSEAGRQGLAEWLAPQVPTRLRAEAALALAPHASRAAALHVLLTDYARYDESLRTRALRAFGASDDAPSAERLFEVARDPASGAAEVLTAIECAGLRAARDGALVERLFAWLDEPALDPEVRTLTITGLVRSGAPGVLARLVARLELFETELRRTDGSAPVAGRERLDREFECETLMASLAATGDPAVIAGFDAAVPFEAPRARAAEEFRARARGEPRAEAEFVARAELELVAAFARAGRLAESLRGVEGWRNLDGRFLLECAERAGAREREVLALAAQIALGGEAASDDAPRARFAARRFALEAARELGDDRAFAARARRLAADVRSGSVPAWLFARAYGDFDPRHGVDGLAELECDAHLARARLARAEGAAEAARAELEAARRAAGASHAAVEAVARLERKWEAAGR